MSPICFSIFQQPPIYLTKDITFTAQSSGMETTDVSSYGLGENAVVLGSTAFAGLGAGSSFYCALNVELSADGQTLKWNWSNTSVSGVTLNGLGAVILDFT